MQVELLKLFFSQPFFLYSCVKMLHCWGECSLGAQQAVSMRIRKEKCKSSTNVYASFSFWALHSLAILTLFIPASILLFICLFFRRRRRSNVAFFRHSIFSFCIFLLQQLCWASHFKIIKRAFFNLWISCLQFGSSLFQKNVQYLNAFAAAPKTSLNDLFQSFIGCLLIQNLSM